MSGGVLGETSQFRNLFANAFFHCLYTYSKGRLLSFETAQFRGKNRVGFLRPRKG